jgi:hypothetical protein
MKRRGPLATPIRGLRQETIGFGLAMLRDANHRAHGPHFYHNSPPGMFDVNKVSKELMPPEPQSRGWTRLKNQLRED